MDLLESLLTPAEIDFLGSSCPDEVLAVDTLVHTNRNKCPQESFAVPVGLSKAEPENLLAIANEAKQVGLHDMAWRLVKCHTDAVIFKTPDKQFGFCPMFCGHRLCPVCQRVKSHALRRRVKEIQDNAHTMVTLTMATYRDGNLKKNIDILRKAFRLMTQRKHKYDWIPFERGYFWRLEVTPGKGFHPHLHVLSCEEWIDYWKLRNRWHDCLDSAGGKGDLLWISATTKKANQEVGKYLSKSLVHFESSRWPALDFGLTRVRTYGSGGILRLPPKPKKGNRIVTFASRTGFCSDLEMLQFMDESQIWLHLREGCSTSEKLHSDYLERKKFGFYKDG